MHKLTTQRISGILLEIDGRTTYAAPSLSAGGGIMIHAGSSRTSPLVAHWKCVKIRDIPAKGMGYLIESGRRVCRSSAASFITCPNCSEEITTCLA